MPHPTETTSCTEFSVLSKPILIHPGFHKTGTTYLQEVLFTDDRGFCQPWDRHFIYEHIIDPHELAFCPETAKAAFAAVFRHQTESAITVVSEEGLCGNPFNGAREACIFARKLRALFDDAYILLTVRNQAEMLRAVYIQYLKAYGRRDPQSFYHPPRFPEFSAFDPDIYQYDRLAQCYAELFGADRVLVLPQELLQRDEDAFVFAMERLIGRKVARRAAPRAKVKERNVSPRAAGIPFLRFGNRFFCSAFNESDLGPSLAAVGHFFRKLGYRKTPLFRNKAAEMENLLASFRGSYQGSNARLQVYCPVDLTQFGYEMP